jgi:hypothetical protein
MWKESVVAYLKVISQHFPGRTEEYYEIIQSGLSIYGPRLCETQLFNFRLTSFLTSGPVY